MIKPYGLDREDEIRGAAEFWQDGGMMEFAGICNRFEVKDSWDSYNSLDRQSCENCRHLGPDETCLVHSQLFRRY